MRGEDDEPDVYGGDLPTTPVDWEEDRPQMRAFLEYFCSNLCPPAAVKNPNSSAEKSTNQSQQQGVERGGETSSQGIEHL